MNALRSKKDNDQDGIYSFNRYILKCWQHLKNGGGVQMKMHFLRQTIWKNRRFFYRLKTTSYVLNSNYLSKQSFTRVGDFFDMDGRIIEAEGVCAQGFSLQARMEWALAVKHIKKYLQRHSIKVTKWFINRSSYSYKVRH